MAPSSKASKSPAPRKPSGGKVGQVTAAGVLCYYPNLIGYLRIACMIGSFWVADSDWKQFLTLYLLAFGGDVVDGWFARRFNQSSTFGGVLDMVTDRVSTCGLLCFLALRKISDPTSLPLLNALLKSPFLYVMLIALDIFSHWFHVMSVSGHHKSSESLQHRNPLLRWYYSIYPLFGYACVGTELFFVLIYLLTWDEPRAWMAGRVPFMPPSFAVQDWNQLLVLLLLPACIIKQAVNVVQLTSAANALCEVDAAEKNK
jgi:CDP-diacylglycerol--inositol 3-phosphatidyltransferase